MVKAEEIATTVQSNGHCAQSYPATKRYLVRDSRGQIRAVHERTDGPAGKQFRWLRPDGTPGLNGMPVTELPLYGSAQLAKLPIDIPVILVEGEKARQALCRRGYSAVGTVTGANVVPCDNSLGVLRNYSVLLWADNDQPGRTHMERIGERLQALGHKDMRIINWFEAPNGGDAADFDGSDEELQTLLDNAEPMSISSQYTLTIAANVVPQKVRWIWKGRIPQGKQTVLDGDPGLGKSLLSLDLAARVSQGRAMPDGSRGDLLSARGVVIVSAEDDPSDTIRPRLEAAGANLSRIGLLTAVLDADGESRPPHLGDIDILRSVIQEMDAGLVIIDPLMAHLPNDRDSHRDQDIRRTLAPLSILANETGVAILVVRHLNKTASGNPIYRGGGSIGIIGAARSGLLVAPDPDDAEGQVRVLASTKCNLSAPSPSLRYRVVEQKTGVPKIEWLGQSSQTAATLLMATEEDQEARTERDAAAAWLREMLANGSVLAKHVFAGARQAGLSEKTLRRAAKSIRVLITKKSFEEGWEWALPETAGSSKVATRPKMVNPTPWPSSQKTPE
jgi:putative DNA primase/helicase